MIKRIGWLQRHLPESYMAQNELMLGPLYGNLAATGWHYRAGKLRSGRVFLLILDGEVRGMVGRFNDGNCFAHCADPNDFPQLVPCLDGLDFHTLWLLNGERADGIDMKRALSLEGRIIEHYMLVQDKPCPVEQGTVEILDINTEDYNEDYVDASIELIHRGFDYKPLKDLWLERLLERTSQEAYYLGRAEGHWVAQAHIQAWTPKYAHVGGVTTLPEYRGRGYARIVTGMLCQYAQDNHHIPTLTVKTENLPAIRLYRSLGFTAAGKVTLIETS